MYKYINDSMKGIILVTKQHSADNENVFSPWRFGISPRMSIDIAAMHTSMISPIMEVGLRIGLTSRKKSGQSCGTLGTHKEYHNGRLYGRDILALRGKVHKVGS